MKSCINYLSEVFIKVRLRVRVGYLRRGGVSRSTADGMTCVSDTCGVLLAHIVTELCILQWQSDCVSADVSEDVPLSFSTTAKSAENHDNKSQTAMRSIRSTLTYV